MPAAEQVMPYLQQIDETSIYSNFGPLVTEFENRIASLFGVSPDQVASCSNATQAITGLLQTSQSLQSEICVPSWTFAATPLAVLSARCTPSFVDVNLDNWESNIPVGDELGVHVLAFGSDGSDSNLISSIPNSHPLIVDAAASFSSISNFKLPQNRSWAIVLSTHATKTLGSGEGGFVISNEVDWIKSFKAWSNFGFWGSRESTFQGTNAKMSEYHAAVGLASLDGWHSTRQLLSDLTNKCLGITEELKLTSHPSMKKGIPSNYWVIRLENHLNKLELLRTFDEANISHRDWWSQGAHRMPAFQQFNNAELPNTELLAETTIGLPFFIGMSNEQLDQIFTTLLKSTG